MLNASNKSSHLISSKGEHGFAAWGFVFIIVFLAVVFIVFSYFLWQTMMGKTEQEDDSFTATRSILKGFTKPLLTGTPSPALRLNEAVKAGARSLEQAKRDRRIWARDIDRPIKATHVWDSETAIESAHSISQPGKYFAQETPHICEIEKKRRGLSLQGRKLALLGRPMFQARY